MEALFKAFFRPDAPFFKGRSGLQSRLP